MNVDRLQKKLVEVAKAAPPSDVVPLAFEKRIMARLRSNAAADPWALWSRSLWRAALACVAVSAVFGVWGFSQSPAPETQDLAVQLENSIYASASAGIEELW
jgi:anti-sigma-K factor RskA